MLESRKLQEKTGRIIPQTNEEYGYEDHYPHWAATRIRLGRCRCAATAWDIVMAGATRPPGETARRGINIWPDTGGGWINGRGDDTMTMFLGYGHMVDFFTSFEWWKTDPHDELVNNGNYCLADPGKTYAVYLPQGGAGHRAARARPLPRILVQRNDRGTDRPSSRRRSCLELAGPTRRQRLGHSSTKRELIERRLVSQKSGRRNGAQPARSDDCQR